MRKKKWIPFNLTITVGSSTPALMPASCQQSAPSQARQS